MFDKVEKNRFGFFSLKEVPSNEELQDYYAKKYYQESMGSYQKTYSDGEIKHISNKIEQKYEVLLKYIQKPEVISKLKLLDIGCGEGWVLKHFQNKGWEVQGLDYSEFGCQVHNPDCIEYLKTGEIQSNLRALINGEEKFDLVWLDNVLEHVIDPLYLLKQCVQVIKDRGLLVIEVPNDFSLLQQFLYDEGYITEPFWVVIPDHISYFNREGLLAICSEAGWIHLDTLADFPIDLNLFNNDTNYIKDRPKGKSCHQARVDIENFIFSISFEKANGLYRSLADLGLGRQIVGFFRKG